MPSCFIEFNYESSISKVDVENVLEETTEDQTWEGYYLMFKI